jgi:putative PIN family toxin of toxin-antitoxin system
LRIVIDTNVIVTAARNSAGASAALLARVRADEVTMVGTIALCLEYQDVCLRPSQLAASHATFSEMQNFLDAIIAMVTPTDIHFKWRPQLRDPADEMVLEAALNGRAAAIVTFNERHFRPVAGQFGLLVLTPAQTLMRLIHG